MRTLEAKRRCAQYLAFCIRHGWSNALLDKLEALWWEHHDEQGNLRDSDGSGPKGSASSPTERSEPTDSAGRTK